MGIDWPTVFIIAFVAVCVAGSASAVKAGRTRRPCGLVRVSLIAGSLLALVSAAAVLLDLF